jgi:hypothetical protein
VLIIDFVFGVLVVGLIEARLPFTFSGPVMDRPSFLLLYWEGESVYIINLVDVSIHIPPFE